ncbi:hypothetical protein BDQ17DRAFT_1385814 [Cyathus striatus]|nr:hypothetical protein BDQ17DRAFT_1385814 [Cyathus striatus]
MDGICGNFARAISFLTGPLIASHPPTTIIKLQLVLEANLTALYAPTWLPKDPLRNSGRRCLTLSPEGLPPRPIYSACIAANIQWCDWIAKLGGIEFDFFVDPGCISVRYGKKDSPDSRMITIWADEIQSPAPVTPKATFQTTLQVPASYKPRKTLAQQLIEDDAEEEDQLFAMIADEVRAPTWMTPVIDHFPSTLRTSSPLSTISSQSRCSSRSSNSSSQFSFASGDVSNSSMSSTLSVPKTREMKQSRRERARQARVYVDTSKTDVTPYDGGKTTVLTGGVMLGGVPKAKKIQPKPATSSANSWRSVRL